MIYLGISFTLKDSSHNKIPCKTKTTSTKGVITARPWLFRTPKLRISTTQVTGDHAPPYPSNTVILLSNSLALPPSLIRFVLRNMWMVRCGLSPVLLHMFHRLVLKKCKLFWRRSSTQNVSTLVERITCLGQECPKLEKLILNSIMFH